jgi:membrane protein implicated in regulation of membrane protease activity
VRVCKPLEREGIMGIIQAFFGTILRWFGFVGSCVIGPNATCVPFLAFLALAAASAAALWLVMRAYRRLRGEDEQRVQVRAERLHQVRIQQRIQRAVAAHAAPRPVSHRGWRMRA